MTNILVLSAGTRNKIVQYFRKELAGKGRVAATDCSGLAPALYDADQAYLVPRIDAPGYIDRILDICRKEKIAGLFSLIDPELSLIASQRERFLEIGTVPVVSSYELCETCLDKYRMYEYLHEKNIRTAACYTDAGLFFKDREAGKISYPVFVKPQKGSASININKVSSDEEVRTLFDICDGLMIQEYMSGQEYGCDVYVDLISGKCTQIFLKKKIKMRAGETDKSVSVRNEELFRMISRFAEESGFRGMIDIDLFLNDGQWYLSEVNPRFGGGYPHAYACGVNFPAALIRNLEGQENPVTIGDYPEGICMMKYNEVMFRKEDELV
jgi:carbamoyl-phosphate synthase large subunit